MSILHAQADEYFALRRALGLKLNREGHLLPQFADWMAERGAATVTAALAVEWAGQPCGVHPVTWSQRLSAVRQFARWLAAADPVARLEVTVAMPAASRLGAELAEQPFLSLEPVSQRPLQPEVVRDVTAKRAHRLLPGPRQRELPQPADIGP
jgi:hypothetical protein